MSETCEQNCNSCGEECSDRKESFRVAANQSSHIKKVIGVVSGKGGVGKSLVTALLAVLMNNKGYRSAILDADITGPSIPKVFGVTDKARGSEGALIPLESKKGIKLMSANFLLADDTDPVIWRGPLIGNMVKQFWTDVVWGDIDYMFIDMPPGTGDVPLTVFQFLPVDGIVVVTSPQDLVAMIVAKAVKMAEMMEIPILGLVENMSYFKCPDNQKDYKIFGDSHVEEIAAKYQLEVLGKMPIDPNVANLCDQGEIEAFQEAWLDLAVNKLEGREKKMKKIAVACEGEQVAQHFGHCESFMIFESDGTQITAEEKLPNPGHKPGFLPNYLNDQGVKVIIAGGMGGGATQIFNEKGFEIITGATGDVKVAVEQYLQGNLHSAGVTCHEHQHSHECGGHCS